MVILTQHLTKIIEFKPIACCNIIYKCKAKILANRLKVCLPSLISWNQSTFIFGRRIVDSILQTHEVVKDYHKPIDKPSMLLKLI